MRHAQKYPEKIEKMIVVDMGVKSYPIHHDQIIEGLKSIDLEVVDSRSEARKMLSKYVESRLKSYTRRQRGKGVRNKSNGNFLHA